MALQCELLSVPTYGSASVPLLSFRSQRLQFDVSSPNGILLFRETSKMITTYGACPGAAGSSACTAPLHGEGGWGAALGCRELLLLRVLGSGAHSLENMEEMTAVSRKPG